MGNCAGYKVLYRVAGSMDYLQVDFSLSGKVA